MVATSDRHLEEIHEKDSFVIRVHRSAGPSVDILLHWLNSIQDYLEDEPLLFLDNVRAHHNERFVEEATALGIKILYYPAYAGALIDPCDNAFHSTLKTCFFHKQHASHAESIRAMLSAYREIPDESVTHFITRCGYTGEQRPKEVVEALVSQGYGLTGVKAAKVREYETAYLHWKRNFRDMFADAHPRSGPACHSALVEM